MAVTLIRSLLRSALHFRFLHGIYGPCVLSSTYWSTWEHLFPSNFSYWNHRWLSSVDHDLPVKDACVLYAARLFSFFYWLHVLMDLVKRFLYTLVQFLPFCRWSSFYWFLVSIVVLFCCCSLVRKLTGGLEEGIRLFSVVSDYHICYCDPANSFAHSMGVLDFYVFIIGLRYEFIVVADFGTRYAIKTDNVICFPIPY